MAPPSGSASKPGRMLALLAALIVLLLVAVVSGNFTSPGKWSRDFHVLLGLDLTSGTTVALEAQAPHGKAPSQQDMKTAVNIMLNRVDAGGFTEASVVQQGNNIINVSVPGQNSQAVVKLVEQTAELLFRQVLLQAPNAAAPVATPTPTPSATGSAAASPSASPSASSAPSATASPTASTKAFVRGAHRSGAVELTRSARSLGGHTAARAAASPSPSPSASAAASVSPSASASPAASPSAAPTAANGTSSWQAAGGDPTLVNAQVKAEFNKLNCADPNWQKEIGYTPQIWNDPHRQIVSCGSLNGVLYKFALDKSLVLGSEIHSASSSVQTGTTFWQVLLNFNSAGAAAFSKVTSDMFSKYGQYRNGGSPLAPLDDLAVVLDGKVISFPVINGAIPGGSAQITGNFDQASATSLANVLSYGALPLSFHQQSVESVTPQLGHDQLTAGLIAAGLGLILVVMYLLFYYRGLAIVAVSSLVIAALLAWLSVIALGKYQHYALSLAGIAGLIVAIGITADSFVVFFERLRDEVREGGKSLRTAVEHGWARARRTILVSDTVSFLAAALLYYFSIGDVRGFAFTLGLTTVIDVVVVFTFTHPVMTLLARTKFFGGGHPLSGLDPVRLGARTPWRGGPRTPARPARPAGARSATAKEA